MIAHLLRRPLSCERAVGTEASRSGKQRFVLLDGMRGVAALAVALFHLAHIADRSALSPNGVLAVDFFFCLSGFVIAHAHDGQLTAATLGIGHFMALRFLRVAPMVWLGTIFGAVLLPFHQAEWAAHGDAVVPTVILSFFVLPWLAGGRVLWINGVFWSLLAELVANFAYAWTSRLLNPVTLAIIIGISAAVFLTGGWGQQPGAGHAQTLAAFPFTSARALTSFFIGVAVLRYWRSRPVHPRVPWLVPVLLLGLVLAVMHRGAIIGWFNTLAVFTAVPAIVYLGACVELRRPWLAEALGAASFPVYALHQPIEEALGRPMKALPHLAQGIAVLAVPLALMAGALMVARLLDEPVRRWLRARLFPRRATGR